MRIGRPFACLTWFAVPLLLGSTFQFLYTFVDAAVVGNLIGVDAFAAVGAAGFLYWLIFSIVLGLTQGFGTVFAQRYGSGDMEGLRRAYGMAAALSLVLGAALTALGVVFTRPLLILLNTPASLFDMTAQFLHLMFAGLLITFAYNLIAAAFRALGDSRTPLYALIFSTVLNVALDILFVKFISATVSAVAVATLIAQLFALLYCVWRARPVKDLRVGRADFRIDRPTIGRLLHLGLPAGVRNAIISLGSLVFQHAINGYGEVFIAGMAAPQKLFGVLNIIGGSMEGAMATFTAQNFGARDLPRIKSGVWQALGIQLVSSVALAALAIAFGRPLMGLLLGSGPNVSRILDYAQSQLTVMALFLPALYLLCMYRAALGGMGHALLPMIEGFIELFSCIAVVLVFPRIWAESGLYYAQAIGWVLAAVPLIIAYYIYYRRHVAEQKPAARAM